MILVHTEYSLLSSTIRIKGLIQKAKNEGIKALAIADKGNLFGAIDFYKEAVKNGIKPIIGCDFGDFVLLCENNAGYGNLIKLSSRFSINGRLSISDLTSLKNGLICLYKNEDNKKFAQIFGQERFYIAINEHNNQNANAPNAVYAKGIYYLEKSELEAYKVLNCIRENKILNTAAFKNQSLHFEAQEKADENARKIEDMCEIEIKFHEYKLPKYDLPKGKNSRGYLKGLVTAGLGKLYPKISPEIKARAEYELELIHNMGFDDYFLITWDFIKFAKENGIAVGPGRGSAAGSLVSYALNITTVCPIKHGLLFERFLNMERISLPDIDIDFCYERRQEVIDYVVQKYGADRVAQIITFGTLGAKASIRDVGRVLGYDYAEVDKIAKMVSFGSTIDQNLESNKTFKAEYEFNERAKRLIDLARQLEGLHRHSSTHAAGVVITDAPLQTYIPLTKTDNNITTQFSMGILEELGLLKIDFLGLRTISVINNAIKDIKKRYNVAINLDELNYADPTVFSPIARGKTEGLFQLESKGMTAFMKELKPSSLEDLTAGISLFRPGPMDFIPKYIAGKKNKNSITYSHKMLEPILKETYGCIVYQEQVMQIAQVLAGFSLEMADILRRAMSKKKESDILKERQSFVDGCKINNISENIALEIFEAMLEFAKYAFNKSHAVCYATIGYQTAFLKAYYPREFMAALLSSLSSQSNKFPEYINECKRLKIDMLPPDINHSYGNFVVENNAIRYGLNAIKNLGSPSVLAIIKKRKDGQFKSINDLVLRLDNQEINKKSLEALILSGALDSIGNRDEHLKIYENLLQNTSNSRRANIDGQISIFEEGEPKKIQSLWLKISAGKNITPNAILKALGEQNGNIPVVIYDGNTKTIMKTIEKFWIIDYNISIREMEKMLGKGMAKMV